MIGLFEKYREKYLYPREYAESLSKIDWIRLKRKKLTNIILDLDETLIPKDFNEISLQVFEFIQSLKEQGFKICLTSNSRHPLRVKYFGETLRLPYFSLALKPFPSAFNNALKTMQAKRENAVVIGDQLLTDILGGNICGIYTIMVKPLSPETFFMRKIMRWMEGIIFRPPF